jgi:hypothetical protein
MGEQQIATILGDFSLQFTGTQEQINEKLHEALSLDFLKQTVELTVRYTRAFNEMTRLNSQELRKAIRKEHYERRYARRKKK